MQLWEKLLEAKEQMPKYPNLQTRLVLLIMGLLMVGLLSWYITGSVIPSDNQQANIFQGGVLLVIFGSLFLEDKFTKPADAVINALTAIISLIPIYRFWGTMGGLVVLYCTFVMVVGIVNLSFGENTEGKTRKALKGWTYRVSKVLGKSNIIFSIVFLYSTLSFYGLQAKETAILVLFWGAYITLFPLSIPQFFQALFSLKSEEWEVVGDVLRVENPALIRIKLSPGVEWSPAKTNIVVHLGDGSKRCVLPLYPEIQDEQVIGTGLLLEESVESSNGYRTNTGKAYAVTELEDLPRKDVPVGLVIEGSSIASIYFETWRASDLSEGLLVFCDVGEKRVYYQVADAKTAEEALGGHRHGFLVVEAHQLGTLSPQGGGFEKFPWVPEMNTPIYLAGTQIQEERVDLKPSQMVLGTIPGSNVEVVCDLERMIPRHTAILGATGKGKTELAYRIIEQAVKNGVKVICVDVTGMYPDKLREMRVESELYDISKVWAELDTGETKKPDKYKRVRDDIGKLWDAHQAIIVLPPLEMREAVMVTGVVLSVVFKRGREDETPILIVLEEAQTLVPESFTFGLNDNAIKSAVGKISQIALQGRKYNVGLLIISQRTATVSKTILTQCNTIISFSTFDNKNREFLGGFYGDHVGRIANLRDQHVLAFGDGVISDWPVVIKIPDNPRSGGSDKPESTKVEPVQENADLPF